VFAAHIKSLLEYLLWLTGSDVDPVDTAVRVSGKMVRVKLNIFQSHFL